MTVFNYGGGNYFAPTYAGGQGGNSVNQYPYSPGGASSYGVANNSTGTAFTGGSAAGAAGWWNNPMVGAAISGLNSAFASRAAGNASLEQAKATVKETKEANAQRRKTMEFEASLGNWTAQSDRHRRSQALREYLKVARAEGPNSGSAIGAMARTDSPHQVEAPGARPDPNSFQVSGPAGG